MFPVPKLPSLTTVASFQTMDKLHYLATGEHLSPISGDACPHPTEYYILMTQRKQQRRRAYDMLFESARKGHGITPVKPGEVNGVRYDHVLGGNGVITLYHGTQAVMTLRPTGEEVVEPTPPPSEAASPARAFCLGPAPAMYAAIPPIPEEEEGWALEPAPAGRLRKNYRRFLMEHSDECLAAELEEWKEELARAEEHVRAIEEEMARRVK
jgi:hypothetical protein